jgi:hypothetical protein
MKLNRATLALAFGARLLLAALVASEARGRRQVALGVPLGLGGRPRRGRT